MTVRDAVPLLRGRRLILVEAILVRRFVAADDDALSKTALDAPIAVVRQAPREIPEGLN